MNALLFHLLFVAVMFSPCASNDGDFRLASKTRTCYITAGRRGYFVLIQRGTSLKCISTKQIIKVKSPFQLNQKFKMPISLLIKDILAYKKHILCGKHSMHISAHKKIGFRYQQTRVLYLSGPAIKFGRSSVLNSLNRNPIAPKPTLAVRAILAPREKNKKGNTPPPLPPFFTVAFIFRGAQQTVSDGAKSNFTPD